ncbi:hypothetical protein CSUI_008372 [Cystoisospora suis]|uniref:Uncharacterized protein n=1 Tax=Cystoisospora suis TaxID=483139 RepID=A0A2C6KN37_9APIC|nr:hypothetical protein CSUI_008372 [Cystoisospora suis]
MSRSSSVLASGFLSQGGIVSQVVAPSTAAGNAGNFLSGESRPHARSFAFSQPLTDPRSLLSQSPAAAAAKRTREMLQTFSVSSFGLPAGQDEELPSVAEAARFVATVGACPEEPRPAKQAKMLPGGSVAAARVCLASISTKAGNHGLFSSSFPFGVAKAQEKLTAMAGGPPATTHGQNHLHEGFLVGKSVLSWTSRNVSVTNGVARAAASPSSAQKLVKSEPFNAASASPSPHKARQHLPAAVGESRTEENKDATSRPVTRCGSPFACQVEELNPVERCRLLITDTSESFGEDWGIDNAHNTRLAQFNYDQAAYRADKAHPGDYTAVSKRIGPETRDLLVCILNQVAAHLVDTTMNNAQCGGGAAFASTATGSVQPSGDTHKAVGKDGSAVGKQSTLELKTMSTDPLNSRAAATVGIALQLFDRFMLVVHQHDVHYGLNAEHQLHVLHGLTAAESARGGSGINNLMLHQLIAIACFCFADRVEAIHAYDYSVVLDAWRQHAVGLFKQSWTPAPSTNLLMRKLTLIGSRIFSHITPVGNVCVPPVSELAEALLNVAVQFGITRAHKMPVERHPEDHQTKQELACSNLQDKDSHVLGGEQATGGDTTGKERRELRCRRTDHLACGKKNSSPRDKDSFDKPASSSAEAGENVTKNDYSLRVRMSSSSLPDYPRLMAQLLARLGQLDRRIALEFKPSVVAAAVCQVALLPQHTVPEYSPLSPAARVLALRAVTAAGAAASARLVRRCQSMLLHKWIKVRCVLELTARSPSAVAGSASLPDRMAADWVATRLTAGYHKDVVALLHRHAEVWLQCAAANLRVRALTGGGVTSGAEDAVGEIGDDDFPTRRSTKQHERSSTREARALQENLSQSMERRRLRGVRSLVSRRERSSHGEDPRACMSALSRQLRRNGQMSAEKPGVLGRLASIESAGEENREN